jgi:hypothetical protein
MRMCVVHVDHSSFQCLHMTHWCNLLNQSGHNNISDEFRIVRHSFRNIKKTVDSVNWSTNRNQTFFCVHFLFDSMRKVITRRYPDRVTGIIQEEPRLITSDNLFKVGRPVFRQRRKKELRIWHSFALLIDRQSVRHSAMMDFFKPSLSWRIRKYVARLIREWWQSTLYEGNGLSASMEPISSPKSFVKDFADLGSSNRSIFPCWKRLWHFFTVGRASASGPYTDSSSVWILLAFSPLSVKEWISTRAKTVSAWTPIWRIADLFYCQIYPEVKS